MTPTAFRAWTALVWFSIRRQGRVRELVVVALILLALSAVLVGLVALLNGWSRANAVPRPGALPFGQQTVALWSASLALPHPAGGALADAALWSGYASMHQSAFGRFSKSFVWTVVFAFLLPIWSLSFATSALGNERENRSLIWLTTRPLPRWAIYLAKYLGILPWVLALNVGGYALLCWLAGPAGPAAFAAYWPAIVAGTLAYTALFHLLGTVVRRPAVIGLVYAFFFEGLINTLPGSLRRMSLLYYIRSIANDAAEPYGVVLVLPPNPIGTALVGWIVLLSVTVALLLLGMWAFSNSEYADEA
jgi:ABC-type transport system involved in multi-copper enzyme maturation permease subunit